ncbi:MAG: prohead protease/major capsid protein fusion protein [Planctomycetota bacterium]
MTTAARTERTGPNSFEVRIAPDSYDEESREFELVMSTGARVRRHSWLRGAYDEVLSLDPAHIRLDRINSGRAPFAEEHRAHQIDKIVGSVVEGSVQVRDGQLVGRVRMHETERAREIEARMANGELCNVSLGYATHEQEVVESEEGPDTRTAVDWEPYEVSLVPMGADDGAHTRSAALETECVVRSTTETPMKTKQTPKSSDAPEPTDQRAGAPEQPAEGNRAPAAPPASPPTDLAAERMAAAAAERERAAEIRKLARKAKLEDEVADDLIERGVELDEARSAIIDSWAKREDGGEISNRVSVELEEGVKHADAITRAFMDRFDRRKYGMKDDDDARGLRGESILELGMRHLRALGVPVDGFTSKNARAKQILQTRGHTTTDFPAILANIAGRILSDGFESAPRDFEPLVRERSAPDFKEIRTVKLGAASQLERVLEGGEYEHGTIGEGAEAYRVLKYGRILQITREAIINDDLDTFTRLPQKLGQQAALIENLIFWALLGENPLLADGLPLFHASRGNIVTSPLGQAGLTEARTAMRLQTDLDGRTRINVIPRFIAVPAELEMEARRLLVLNTVPNETSQANPFTGTLAPIGSPFLSDYSDREWYMLASPSEVDTLEMAYLQGERAPYLETQDGFETDGVKLKLRHQFGMKPIDHRGLVKSTGQG